MLQLLLLLFLLRLQYPFGTPRPTATVVLGHTRDQNILKDPGRHLLSFLLCAPALSGRKPVYSCIALGASCGGACWWRLRFGRRTSMRSASPPLTDPQTGLREFFFWPQMPSCSVSWFRSVVRTCGCVKFSHSLHPVLKGTVLFVPTKCHSQGRFFPPLCYPPKGDPRRVFITRTKKENPKIMKMPPPKFLDFQAVICYYCCSLFLDRPAEKQCPQTFSLADPKRRPPKMTKNIPKWSPCPKALPPHLH